VALGADFRHLVGIQRVEVATHRHVAKLTTTDAVTASGDPGLYRLSVARGTSGPTEVTMLVAATHNVVPHKNLLCSGPFLLDTNTSFQANH